MAVKTTKPSPTGANHSRADLIASARRRLRAAVRAVGRAEREFDILCDELTSADTDLATAAPGAAIDDANAALAALKPRRSKKGPAK